MRSLRGLGVVVVAVLGATPARAGKAEVLAECLSSSEESIVLQTRHKLRAARARLAVCAASACPPDVRSDCAARLQSVVEATPEIFFTARDKAGHELREVAVTMDDEPFLDVLGDSPVSVDPGPHRFVFTASGQPKIVRTFTFREGEKGRRESVVLAAPEPAPEEHTPTRSARGQRIAGVTLVGVGALTTVVGAVLGVHAISLNNDSASHCGVPSDPNACDPAGIDLRSSALSSARASTVLVIVGASTVVAGVALWLTAPSGHPGVSVAVGPAGFRVGGAW